ncbi:beta-1,3-galactosyl-O-glycosyl-glycoprotein beta-1,6-N-acetylglucosaminyltransferase-like [Mizuhopecten yessoensis]|uniref:Beta-1,3-galactosyl-O-glycosyl-glycoprotein beta-1,6-N-acetylglucosaminyltransferase n=1 Tax=Mizuhopecten yessoensis TaxID=6573 RepID=A0A210QRX9_MIZYE|nr:beta-1,3-galactosyl-O-glycosyl-glycoprotein beta-1,6-N-acetylglucosaminyltransferase-like [Mizuhopecten yessoensis]OWF51496.1 Beta-1,3-galactosyl-O-glycosyl-glycoprotein beta-1,6-N-acetylglucosaminyltransferase [Mizuhopecten yessoensis]
MAKYTKIKRYCIFVFLFAFAMELLQFLHTESWIKVKSICPSTICSKHGLLLSWMGSNKSVTHVLADEQAKQSHDIYHDRFHFVFPDLPRQSVLPVSCPLLFAGNKTEQKRAMLFKRSLQTTSSIYYQEQVQNCTIFKQSYITSYLTREEKEFPLAYSLLVYKDLMQVERLLRAIYRPQNVYCIHIDLTTAEDFRKTLSTIADCFDNVFITKRSVNVRWGTFTVLEPEILCMEELWKYKTWKYFINLTGQEFPLRTNGELVKILKIYNGTNDVAGTLKRANVRRWAKAGTPPAGITPGKGGVHITVNRHFVDYILHNQTAQAFLNWCRNTSVPDETFFASLNHNAHLGIPGSANGYVEPYIKNSRFKNWGTQPCAGRMVRSICIFGIGDLPVLSKRKELFANKFYMNYQTFTFDCMEELIYNRTKDGYFKKMDVNTTYYENLQFLKNRI